MALIFALVSLITLTVLTDAYRLNKTFSIEQYQIHLNFPPEIFSTENSTRYSGTTLITFTPNANTDVVVLHSNNKFINIKSASLQDNTTSNTAIICTNITGNTTTELVTLQFNGTLLQAVRYSILLEFDGNVSTTDMYGIYKSSYTELGKKYYFVTTQFEATFARRAFPCFDEPSFKAVFKLSVTYPNGLRALFNTPVLSTNTSSNDTDMAQFQPSPKMSSYLIAFIISNLTCSQGVKIENSLVSQVCSRNDTVSNRAWALEVTTPIIDSINAYTGINYSRSMSKLDQVAITDFSAGAMENWGLVTYRERALLYDDNETSNVYKQYIASVIAHELAHQWFGNLVTCKWWSEIFLNEGFARLLQNFITHEILPDYEMDKQFVTKTLQYVFEEDASSSESLRDSATTPNEISARFGDITYDKGGSVLRMVESFLGTSSWKTGLNAYLNNFTYSSAEPDDLWNSISSTITNGSSLPASLNVVMNNWINSPGYPVLNAVLNGTTVTVTQKRFVFNNSLVTNVSWYVPLTYTTSNNTNTFTNTIPSLWLTPNQSAQYINLNSNDTWIVLNNLQSGYYRVNYDSILWNRLGNALKKTTFSNIPEINRAQIVNDAFNLARVGSINYTQLFNITQFLANETSYHVWYSAFNGFNYLLKRFNKNSTLYSSIAKHVSELSSTLVNSVPLSVVNASNHIYTLSQVQAQLWACKLNNTNCTASAAELFKNYTATSIRPNKNLRSLIYCYGLKSSSNITADWNFLWQAFLNIELSTEQVTLLATLGCSSDKNILKQYLRKTLDDNSGIRSQDYASVYGAVYQNSDVGVDVALDFFIENHNLILQRYTSLNTVGNILKRIAELITTDDQLNKLKTFINGGSLNGTMLDAANTAQKSAKNNLDWVANYRNQLLTYYNLSAETSTNTTTIISTTTAPAASTPATTSASKGSGRLGVFNIGFSIRTGRCSLMPNHQENVHDQEARPNDKILSIKISVCYCKRWPFKVDSQMFGGQILGDRCNQPTFAVKGMLFWAKSQSLKIEPLGPP